VAVVEQAHLRPEPVAHRMLGEVLEPATGDVPARVAGDRVRPQHRHVEQQDQVAEADPEPEPPNLSAIENRTSQSAFSHRVPFEVGATYLHSGDRITIEEVRGTALRAETPELEVAQYVLPDFGEPVRGVELVQQVTFDAPGSYALYDGNGDLLLRGADPEVVTLGTRLVERDSTGPVPPAQA
jgi:hypothetical protein